jgi:hypothetical protein
LSSQGGVGAGGGDGGARRGAAAEEAGEEAAGGGRRRRLGRRGAGRSGVPLPLLLLLLVKPAAPAPPCSSWPSPRRRRLLGHAPGPPPGVRPPQSRGGREPRQPRRQQAAHLRARGAVAVKDAQQERLAAARPLVREPRVLVGLVRSRGPRDGRRRCGVGAGAGRRRVADPEAAGPDGRWCCCCCRCCRPLRFLPGDDARGGQRDPEDALGNSRGVGVRGGGA